ncbi:DUF1015 domain-containing protein [Streptomyces sp. B1866]|uniref:DUF1015 domain-containing protein n=1 Tax=Streptomyces sp. B1866 TaxID=3075431 RepID=UPI0028928A50|nr:DUF1015 domain-containing protein [Streptomyces sp. B1866]MDT3397184.1 DUF1015 domain-containing protein [Streptomyces sp. B1866]
METSEPVGGGLQLLPFRGLRYVAERVGSLAAVTSPPYDVVVRPEGQRELETADPYNIVRLILPRAGAPADPPAARHRHAAETLRRWQDEGVLAADPEPGLYVYEQRDAFGGLQRGLIGALRLTAQEEGAVLPHEDVMPDVVAERAALMRATGTQLEPLLLAYRGDTSGDAAPRGAAAVVERAAAGPALASTSDGDGTGHRLWQVTDPAALAEVAADLTGRRALIADGHHRWATYRLLSAERGGPGPWDRGLVLLVDSARYPLRVRAIHRLLRRLPPGKALAAVDGAFRVRPVAGPLPRALDALAAAGGAAGDGPGNAFLLAGEGRFHLLDRPDPDLLARAVPADRPAAWRALDTAVLHHLLLGRVWRLPDGPEDVGYLHDAAAAVAQAERGGGTAVLMRPVREEVVRELAGQGVAMPHKSTSFGPKPASGLVLRSLALG